MVSTHCVQNKLLNHTYYYKYYSNAIAGYLIFKSAAANWQQQIWQIWSVKHCFPFFRIEWFSRPVCCISISHSKTWLCSSERLQSTVSRTWNWNVYSEITIQCFLLLHILIHYDLKNPNKQLYAERPNLTLVGGGSLDSFIVRQLCKPRKPVCRSYFRLCYKAIS